MLQGRAAMARPDDRPYSPSGGLVAKDGNTVGYVAEGKVTQIQ